MMLAEQGRLNLDDKISRWFPDLLSAEQVTIRMLVGNTAGYLDYAPTRPSGTHCSARPSARLPMKS
jgi:CubicO group peptidase (beta-lactamase class C family)